MPRAHRHCNPQPRRAHYSSVSPEGILSSKADIQHQHQPTSTTIDWVKIGSIPRTHSTRKSLQGGRVMAESKWKIGGEYMESCNCDYLCPCIISNPQAPVTYDQCTSLMVYRIDRG